MVGLGLRTFLVNDEIASNLNFNGSALSLHGAYEVLTKKQNREFHALFASPNLSNDFNNHHLDGVFISFDFHWRFKIGVDLPWGVKWYLGPYARVQGFSRTFHLSSVDLVVENNDSFTSLGLSSLFQKSWSDDKIIRMLFAAPVWTYINSRQDRSGMYTSEWMFPDRFADYQFRVAFIKKGLKAVNFFLAYQYNIVIEDRDTRISYGGHLFETGLKFLF